MGQILANTPRESTSHEDDGNNGLILGDKYVPQELIVEILCHVDHATLLTSQLVCKRWRTLIHSYVWREKAELTIGRSLRMLKDVPWQLFYVICKKQPFDRNLVKNHSGQDGVDKHWKILSQGGDHWKVECPPLGIPPLPSEVPTIDGKQYCFVTSYYICGKQQIIKLVDEGLTPELLDKLQPPIVVSEWYGCRWDCPAIYECTIRLIGKHKKVLDTFEFNTIIENDLQFQWHKMSHVFRNYGPGVEEILFYHGGTDNLFWAGHYGSKMSGASVVIKLPESHNPEVENDLRNLSHTDEGGRLNLREQRSGNRRISLTRWILYVDEID